MSKKDQEEKDALKNKEDLHKQAKAFKDKAKKAIKDNDAKVAKENK